VLKAPVDDENPSYFMSELYEVGRSEDTDNLNITAISFSGVEDVYGNALQTITSIPDEAQLSANGTIKIDTAPPTSTITGASYSSGVITLTGTDFTVAELGVGLNDSVKDLIDWSKLTWDINGDNGTTGGADNDFRALTADDIESAIITNNTATVTEGGVTTDAHVITITLDPTTTDEAGETLAQALRNTAGFGIAGGADDLIIGSGFIKDTAGNLSTTAILPGADGSGITGELDWGDQAVPVLQTLTTDASKASNRYGDTDSFTVTATFNDYMQVGTSIIVTLNSGRTLELKAPENADDNPTKTMTGG
jgi:hypothetical protein